MPRSVKPFIVVLTWNNSRDTLECLRSLEQTCCSAEVLVVDNGSVDGSLERIRAALPQSEILETGVNLGYAGGNNFGIRCALARGATSICVLNNDIIVTPGFLAGLQAALDACDEAGIVMPLVAESSRPDRVWSLGTQVDRTTGAVCRLYEGAPVSDFAGTAPFEIDAASGAAMLIRRDVFERAGYMDEEFFLYFEETDWCLRVRRAGFRIFAVPASIVLHKVSASIGQSSPLTDYYMLRNHLRFVGRQWPRAARWAIQARIVSRNLLTVLAYTVKPQGGQRKANRDARLLALRDAALGRSGRLSPQSAATLGQPVQ